AIASNGTEEAASKEGSVPRTPLPIVTTPLEEATIKIGPTMRHASELNHTTTLHTSTSLSPSSREHSYTVAGTTETVEASGTYTPHTVIESSSTSFAESSARATATVTVRTENFGKTSEINVTLSPPTEAANEEKQPLTLPPTKTPSNEASQSSFSAGKTETYGPAGMSTTTETDEEVPKKGISESSKVIPPYQHTVSTPDYEHRIFHLASTNTEEPRTTILLEVPASENGREGVAAKQSSETTHLNVTNVASETNTLHPISEPGKFIVTTAPEATTALPVDQFTRIGSEKTEVTASTTAIEDKLRTTTVQEETTVRSESIMMTSPI
uniref:Uncharacterized protein n=1 Tax=Parascaris univalens TaxID=6257 RepID=A0A915AGL1_PARUN